MWFRALAMVAAAGPGRGGGVSLELKKITVVGEEGGEDGGCRRCGRVSPELRRDPTAPRRATAVVVHHEEEEESREPLDDQINGLKIWCFGASNARVLP